MTQLSTGVPLQNLLGIREPDGPIYRIFPLKRLRQALSDHRMALVAPAGWEDPFENLIAMCGITHTGQTPYHQEFFDWTRRPVFGQCWTLSSESDAMWRIYSTVMKNLETNRSMVPDTEGVRVRTTPRKLLGALAEWSPNRPAEHYCFLGRVLYFPEQDLLQQLTQIVVTNGLNAFAGGRGHAQALLAKRDAFAHEQEVRLLYVKPENSASSDLIRFIDVDAHGLFDELTLDPRLGAADVEDRTAEFRSCGYEGSINKSLLYQRVLLDIHLP